MKSKSYYLVGPGQIEERDIEIGKIPEGSCLLKTLTVGICAGDSKYFFGEKEPQKLKERLPLIQGHEGSGKIIRCEDECLLSPGEIVVPIPFVPCGRCPECKQGKENYCKNRKMMGSNAPGLFRTHFVYPAAFLRSLPQEIPEEMAPYLAALTEPASVAYRASSFIKKKKPAKVAVFGTGPIGYLLTANLSFFKKIPRRNLYFFGRSPEKLEMAKDFATTIQITKGMEQYSRTFDVVFEAVGVQKSVQNSLDLTKEDGHCIVIGISDSPVVIRSNSEEQKIPNLTEFVNSGGQLKIGEKTLLTSAFSKVEDYEQVIKAMGNPSYRKILSQMINPDRIIPVKSPDDIKVGFKLYKEFPHIQKVFFSFGGQRKRR